MWSFSFVLQDRKGRNPSSLCIISFIRFVDDIHPQFSLTSSRYKNIIIQTNLSQIITGVGYITTSFHPVETKNNIFTEFEFIPCRLTMTKGVKS